MSSRQHKHTPAQTARPYLACTLRKKSRGRRRRITTAGGTTCQPCTTVMASGARPIKGQTHTRTPTIAGLFAFGARCGQMRYCTMAAYADNGSIVHYAATFRAWYCHRLIVYTCRPLPPAAQRKPAGSPPIDAGVNAISPVRRAKVTSFGDFGPSNGLANLNEDVWRYGRGWRQFSRYVFRITCAQMLSRAFNLSHFQQRQSGQESR